ncbi:putative ATPase [Murinocardiopsis flavida]|uniref:Putative ATPase n=1 Tax=Murinocardiopsis flavida TaxID=645275 RepID=A0A2P8CW05_9ACTN|nr:tetratricopeptide repeat protein [Murinocardiopsis flavida]PSK89151.1 putative ATPase [Murinocardiopsis flavida]
MAVAHISAARHSLPLEPNGFVGRSAALATVGRLLTENRVVTLCGSGGIGKTRLALRVAALTAADRPDEVRLVELAAASGRDHIVSRIAIAAGVTEETVRPLQETLFNALSGRRLLLVLDTCEHVADDVAELGRALVESCPQLTLLLTSREPVRIPGEALYWVAPLSLPPASGANATDSEAVRLFLNRARASSPGFTAAPDALACIAEICRRLDGLPLGIELAAARVRLLSLPEIAERLDDRFRFLTVGDRSAPARQRNLRAVIDWSHALLTPSERVLLRRLSVFANWEVEQAERVCADALLPEDGILDLLSSLVERSLVVVAGEFRGRVRYRMLDTIRDYAADRLAESGEADPVRDRLGAQMVRCAESLGRNAILSRPIPWAERFDSWHRVEAEYDNFRAALHRAAARGDTETGLRLCVGLRAFWIVRGYFAEGAEWTDRFLAMGGAAPALRGRAMVRRAELTWEQKDHRHTSRIGDEGLVLCRDAGDHDSVCLALNILATIDMRQGRLLRATARLSEMLRLARRNGDIWNEGIARGTLGTLAARQGGFQQATFHCEEALRLLRGIDHRWGVARTLIGHGVVAENLGDLDRADRCFREAMEIQREVGGLPELARCLAGLGRVAARRGEAADAYAYFRESLVLCHGIGQRLGVARGLEGIARIAAGDGLAADAGVLAGAAATLRERLGITAAPRRPEGVGVRAWNEGRALAADSAVARAVEVCSGPRSQRRDQAVADAPALTRREAEIAHLIGTGMSNRAIAAELFISPVTVARHVANIHTKLGFNSREQIAEWVVGDAVPT